MSKFIGPLTQSTINAIILELKKKSNKDRISKSIITPLLTEIVAYTYPYLFIFTLVQLTIIVLLIYIIIKLRKNQ